MATVNVESIPTTCKHHRRADDPHFDDLCETCKTRYDLRLCTLKARCGYCSHLTKAQFNELVLVPRHANEKAKERRRLREKQNRAAGLPPRSPATSVKSTGSAPPSGKHRQSLRDKFEAASRHSDQGPTSSDPPQPEAVDLSDPNAFNASIQTKHLTMISSLKVWQCWISSCNISCTP